MEEEHDSGVSRKRERPVKDKDIFFTALVEGDKDQEAQDKREKMCERMKQEFWEAKFEAANHTHYPDRSDWALVTIIQRMSSNEPLDLAEMELSWECQLDHYKACFGK